VKVILLLAHWAMVLMTVGVLQFLVFAVVLEALRPGG
jgi:hypothetical protein